MPVYNGSRYLGEAIKSILNQTFSDFEFLIIDDASTDDSVEIIKSYEDARIRLIENEKNFGLSATLNKGLDLAHGKYIARMDQDDLSLPNRLQKQVQYLEDHPNICVLGTWWKNIDENNKTLCIVRLPIQAFECGFWVFVIGEQAVGHPCVMFRLAEIISLGGYDEKYNIAQDLDLWFRASANDLQFANIPEVMFSYRIHSKQGSKNSQTDIEHKSALSAFLSEILLQHVDPLAAALIQPCNFNDSYFQSEKQIEEMFKLKERSLELFFKKHKLKSIEIVKCCITLWESLLPLCALKNINRVKIIYKNIIFCFKHLEKQFKSSVVYNTPYFIIFFFLLPKLPLEKFIRNPIHFFKKVF